MSIIAYHCDIYELEYLPPDFLPHNGERTFFIEFIYETESFTNHRTLTLSHNQLLHSLWYASYAISLMLSGLNITSEIHSNLVSQIIDHARSIVTYYQTRNMTCITIPLVVNIRPEFGEDEEEAISAAIERSFNEQVVNMVPASRSSIEALEKTRVEGVSKQCVICLDKILVGSEATRMPCSHVYHQACIVHWLETSNICPLCRFQMPNR